MAWLLVSEVKVFLSTSIETSTTIQNNFDNQDYTILAINVTIIETPCAILTVEFTNDVKMGQEEELIEGDRLARTRMFPNGSFVRGDSVYENTKQMTDPNEIAKYMKENLV